MDLDPSPAPRLLIETGSHRDAASAIPLGETRVGAAFEAEIGVSDLNAPIAFALRRSTTALTVVARDAPLRLAGKTIRPGQSRICRGSSTLFCGPVRFRLELPVAATPARAPAPRWRPVFGAFAAGAVCAAVLTLGVSLHAAPFSPFSFMPRIGADTTGSIATLPAATAPELEKPKPSSAALLGGLRRQAAAVGLETLDLRAQSDGAITANGTIAPFQEAAWHEIGRWFDTEAHGRFVLVDDVKVANVAPVLQIQAVWPGRNPYVVDGGGQKLFVGSSVADGWIIRSIDRSRVLIKRGEQLVAVRF